VAQAALLAQMTTGFSVSPLTPTTYLTSAWLAWTSPTTSGSRSRTCSARRSQQLPAQRVRLALIDDIKRWETELQSA
jgi:hypothetical protein